MIDDSTQYIARISYGKDSLKMLNVIKSRGLPLDRITTTDVWATDTIPANLPPMMEFKDRMDQRIWDMYRIEVEHLCAMNKDGSKKTYEQMFYHVPVRRSQTGQVERERERETVPGGCRYRIPSSWTAMVPDRTQETSVQNAGQQYRIPTQYGIQLVPETQTLPGQQSKDSRWQQESHGVRSSKSEQRPNGFPEQISPWCRKLKIDKVKTPFFDERPARRRDRNIVEYLGIAADEPKRFGQLNERKRAPLVEFGIDEDLCGLYCQYADMLSPTYDTSCRDGCWFCHNQGVDQLRLLRKNYPDYWALLMKWDLDSPVSFKADGHTVHDFDFRFRLEEMGIVPADRTFRWRMLDEPPAFTPYVGEQLSIF